jgi:hypothetical protein
VLAKLLILQGNAFNPALTDSLELLGHQDNASQGAGRYPKVFVSS